MVIVFDRVRRFKLRRSVVLPAALVAVAVALSACSDSGFQFVSSSDRKAFFKVPSDWRFFDKREMLVASGQSLSAETNRQLGWLIGFDADPNPAIEHVIDIVRAPRYPVITARVQELNFSLRDNLSLKGLRGLVYDVDRLVQSNHAEMLVYEDLALEGGFHGSRMLYDIIPAGISNVGLGNEVIRVNQISVIDPKVQKVYVFTIRCESHCYQENRVLLDQIADSWTVKER